MRHLSLKSPVDLPAGLPVVGFKNRRREPGPLVALLAILALFPAGVVRADQGAPDKTDERKVAELIERVRAEEAKYQNLEIVTKRLHRTLPGGPIPWTVQQEDETVDCVRQKGLLHADVRIVRTLNSGNKLTQEIVSGFDGERTRTVEMG